MKAPSEKKTRILFWCLAALLGFLQAWASRMTLVNDTVSYLDMGDYMWSGHFSMAINGIWNPFYAYILGALLWLFKPSSYWQYPLVHLLLFFIFLGTIGCFDFFLRELIYSRQQKQSDEEFNVPVWIWVVIGYTLFLWTSLGLIHVSETNPDMMLAAFFYLACGFLVRINRGYKSQLAFPMLGLVLGLGYLTKSIMFPVSLLCMAIAWIAASDRQRRTWGAVSALAVFLVFSVPFIAALSKAKHKITFGESGSYNYAVHVNKIDPHYWVGENPGNGFPVHRVHKIVDHPATFEYGTMQIGTYPNWYDPSFWYEGVKDRVNLHEELVTVRTNFRSEVSLLFDLTGSILCGLFILFFTSASQRITLIDFLRHWFLWVPALAALGLYMLVWFEPRYVAPFIVVFLLCCFMSIHHNRTVETGRIFSAVAVLIFVMFMSPLGSDTVPKNFSAVKSFIHPLRAEPNSSYEIAKGMYQMGLKPGDRISSLEFSNLDVAMWARLAELKIVAEVYYWPGRVQTSGNNFWNADVASQQDVMHAFASTGACAVVSNEQPRGASTDGWLPVGQTGYYLHWLPSSASGMANKITKN